jgi:hypothetical protein
MGGILNAAAIHFASRRQNWARIVLLVLTLIGVFGVLGYIIWPTFLEGDPGWLALLSAVTSAMEVTALYWLFFGSGARWYASATVEGTR